MSKTEPDYITKSKELCRLCGMDPNEVPGPKRFMTSEELTLKREAYGEILSVVSFFSHKLLESLKGTPILIVISDAEGYLLDMVGDQTIKSLVKQFGIKEGSLFTQEDAGTNVVSLSLEQGYPITLIGENHYHTLLHGVACYGAAFHYTDGNNILGSVSIMMPIEFQNPLFLTMLSQVVDSIERELLLRKQNHKLNIMNQIILSRTNNGIVITDENGITTEFNEFAQKVSNRSRDSVIGRSIFESDVSGTYFKKVLKDRVKYEDVELKFTNPNGDPVVVLFDAQPIYKNHKLIGAFGQFRDITDRYLIEKKYNYLAYHDDLTGLPNRRYIQKEIKSLIQEEQPKLAIMFLDLDRFKVINDTFGHSSGDLLLIEVTKRLSKCLGINDQLARMGGDEFILLLKNYEDEEYVIRKAEQILAQFKKHFNVKSNQFHTTASIGVAIYPDQPLTLEEFMIIADNAMYKAKARGKNNYFLFNSDMFNHVKEELKLVMELRDAVKNEELVLHYQPQICYKTGKNVGLEALIRWNHPELGLIAPDKFIPFAEESGLIIDIGEWIIKKVCIQNKKWRLSGLKPIKIAVNLSPQQFHKENLVGFVRKVLNETELEPDCLILEITESMAMDVEHALKVLEDLKEIGVEISIDDFGTGYSSLNSLKQFPIDYLKIDRSFVSDITNDDNDKDIVKAIITLAHNLNLKVVAEGVETEDQLAFLRKNNCDYFQGFLFSKPLSSEDFEKSVFFERQE
ncbi:EAL domain-containing protein [Bacillus sp. JJ1562]|uniref:EAL domain-containing protein n=1 Tax=Bacillus sp. JJ1562 TaxID=3122960 RepID=UPI0030016E2E